MKRLIYVLLLVFISAFSSTAKSKIDSLKNLLQNAGHDSNRVNILLKLSSLERNISIQEALDDGNKALALAEDIDWNDGIATAYLRLGNTYTFKGDSKKALEYYTKSLDIYRQKENKVYIEKCQGNMANCYSNLGDYPKALEYYRLSLEESEKIRDTIGVIANLNCIGLVFATLGDYPKSLDYYQRASVEAQSSGDNYEIASVLNNIGDLYKKLNDTVKALNSLKQSLQISKKIGNNKLEALTLLSIGKLLGIKNDSASIYLNQSMDIYRKMGRDIGVANCLEQLGLVYEEQKKYSTALDYTLQAGELFSKEEEQDLLAENYFQAGSIYKDSLRYEKAEENFMKSLELAKKLGIKETQRDALQGLSDLYGKLKQPEKELSAYKDFISMRDSIMNGDKAKTIQLKEIEYTDLQTKIEEESRKAAAERKHNLQLLGIGVFILSLIICVTLLSKIKIKPAFIRILGVLALLLLFEFVSLLIEPLISKFTDDNPLYTFLVLVGIASILIPTHHRLEHWVKEHLTKKHHTHPVAELAKENPDVNPDI